MLNGKISLTFIAYGWMDFDNQEKVSGDGMTDFSSCNDHFLCVFFFNYFKFISRRNRVSVILLHHIYFVFNR